MNDVKQLPHSADNSAAIEALRGIKIWAKDHVVGALALCVTLLAAAGYSVHRSWLFGWYQAAGIPPFSHGWSAQDVVMLGVLNVQVWAIGLLAVTGLALMVYLGLVSTNYLERRLDKWLSNLADKLVDTAKEKTWMPALVTHASMCVVIIWSSVLVLCVILLATKLLYSQPRELGREQFEQTLARASHSFAVVEDAMGRGTGLALERAEAIEALRRSHGHVRATVGVTQGAPSYCGWLVLQNGEHMLLLTREGPLFLSTSGHGFSWRPVALDEC